MTLTDVRVSMLMSEAEAGWPTGEIDDAILDGLDDVTADAVCEALMIPVWPPSNADVAINDLRMAGLVRCGECLGAGEVCSGGSVSGVHYEPCEVCAGAGLAR